MNREKEKKGFKWLEKLKKIKHIEIYISIIFLVIILLIYLSNFSGKSKTKTQDETMSINSYVEQLEESLEDILSNIGGVSNVKVLITLDMKSASINNSNITLDEFPEIKGIIITAKGVSDTYTRMKVLHAVEAVVEVKNGNIEILSCE